MSYCSIEEAWGLKANAVPESSAALNNGIMLNGRYQGRDMTKRNVSNWLSRESRVPDQSANSDGINAESHQLFRNNNYETMLQEQLDANKSLDSYSQSQVHKQYIDIIGDKRPACSDREFMTNTEISPYNSLEQLQAIDLQTPLAQPVELGQFYTYKNDPLNGTYAVDTSILQGGNIQPTQHQKKVGAGSGAEAATMDLVMKMLKRVEELERDVVYLKSNQSPKVLGTNIHDIILFVLVGIFIIFVLDGIFRIGRMTI